MSNNIIKLLEHKGCKVQFILNFFGEELNKDCGHCEWCITKNDTTPVTHPKYHLKKYSQLQLTLKNCLTSS